MGCEMMLTLGTADRSAANAAFDEAVRRVAQFEDCLSRFRSDSELSQLNAHAGVWTKVSPLLGTVLQVALAAARSTGGLCSPSLLPEMEEAGYDRDFAQLDTSATVPRPSPARTSDLLPAPRLNARSRLAAHRLSRLGRRRASEGGWRSVHLIPMTNGMTQAWVPRSVRLDLGGVAKGWTADQIAALLKLTGPCLVDAGGDLAARGAPPGSTGWWVGVADPFHPDQDLAMVLLRDAGIATSGVDFRRWVHQGRPQHHLIDPRTGQSAKTDVLTASVIARTTVTADMHAKAALLLGARGGLAYLVRKRLAGLIVRRDGRVLQTPRWADYAVLA